jgi:alpha-galactosidase
MNKTEKTVFTRRGVLGGFCASAAVAVAGVSEAFAQTKVAASPQRVSLDVLAAPVSVTVFAGLKHEVPLTRKQEEWSAGDTVVAWSGSEQARHLSLSAPSLEPTHVRIRWKGSLPDDALVLGDAWERSYGDLQWQSWKADRPLPWYAAVSSQGVTSACGVMCGAGALAFWQMDRNGISLWLDVRNGGEGVRLGSRVLSLATIVTQSGASGESAAQVLRALCRKMSPSPRKVTGAVFGTNDWYYAYGKNTAEGIERDADLIVSLAPAKGPKPYTIIDDGWRNTTTFPDMRALASSIRSRGARPGIWVRPLQAAADTPANLLLANARYGNRKDRYRDGGYDPTIPEALEAAVGKVRQVAQWGYELVKHDFSTYELFGQWGNEMGASPTLPGWHFNDRSRTNAEIVLDLYRAIRGAAGEQTSINGCNTIGHLAAGIFESNRCGDDVSGKIWERTRRMAVNTLAYRIVQHRAFFLADADYVPITRAVEWKYTAQWMDLIARSGTPLILSPEREAIGAEQKAAIRDALQMTLSAGDAVAPKWQEDTTPELWHFDGGKPMTYDWTEPDGTWPFGI